ncbi:sugar ABC transporter substrate-binding protein [Psychromarinibacter sp. C21-152]|uniref:Sugar ABC transporter substrate-binding protein n=1 Tax=Psychromarinibacter sediminicola TaxID=3033385 RepID=A0AAE3NZG0_9RHOB|nr:sugar ABC transporter substrate-binding protein [Psychromarinibacter sediminicola]MDF0603750.1 sugar ABC transporter substrate-binding protein [Psychromarinibacter sediminicola]
MKYFKGIGTAAVLSAGFLAAGADRAAAQTANPDGPIIVVSGPLSWPFFAAVKQGFDDGAETFGIDFQYVAVTDTANMTSDYPRLLQQAISRDPKMLLVGEFFPDGMDPLIREATDAGIPVLIHNSGQTLWEENGSIGFVGEEPFQMGYRAGEIQAAEGVTLGLCFNQVPGNPTVEARCDGYIAAMEEAGADTIYETIGTGDATNPQALAQAMSGILQANPGIDGIFTLNAVPAMSALQAVSNVGREGEVMVGTADLSNEVLEAIQDGRLAFAMDQQPYLQGFMSMQIASHFLEYGLHPIGHVKTGPLVIDSSNVERTLEVNNEHTGIRGAF